MPHHYYIQIIFLAVNIEQRWHKPTNIHYFGDENKITALVTILYNIMWRDPGLNISSTASALFPLLFKNIINFSVGQDTCCTMTGLAVLNTWCHDTWHVTWLTSWRDMGPGGTGRDLLFTLSGWFPVIILRRVEQRQGPPEQINIHTHGDRGQQGDTWNVAKVLSKYCQTNRLIVTLNCQ